MRLVGQVRKKEGSLSQHPSASLQLMHVGKFIQEYLHVQQRHMINLSASLVQTQLPLFEQSFATSFDLDLNVPYINSEHYDSSNTFTDEQNIPLHHDLDDENFTQREESSVQAGWANQAQPRRKQIHEEADFSKEDLVFVKKNRGVKESDCSRKTQGSCGYNSTKVEEETETHPTVQTSEDVQLHHLQETAYFLHQKEQVQRKLTYQNKSIKYDNSSAMHIQSIMCNNQNVSSLNCMPMVESKTSKKALFLNKIEKEKTRKQIAEMISRERHHIRKFLK